MSRYQEVYEALKFVLKDIKNTEITKPLEFISEHKKINISRIEIPVPELVYFIFTKVCKIPTNERLDKQHWRISFRYKNADCEICYEKSGLKLYYVDIKQTINPNKFIGRLKKAVVIFEKKYLKQYAHEQIKSGKLLIPNNFIKLHNMYWYFRTEAKNCFDNSKNEDLKGLNHFSERLESEAKGFYNTYSMINAYFSVLEHFFVLLLPFVNNKTFEYELIEYIYSAWSDKFKKVFDIHKKDDKKFYDLLNDVKRVRNTFAHGGFEKDGASLFFFLPDSGFIPTQLTNIKGSPNFKLVPIEEMDYLKICKTFDDFDEWIQNTKYPKAWKFAWSAVDLYFDKKFLAELREVSKYEEVFDDWIFAKQRMATDYINADY